MGEDHKNDTGHEELGIALKHLSREERGVGKHSSPPHTTTAKITAKLQYNYQPESSENRAVWKFDN